MLLLNLLQFSTGYARIGTLSQAPMSGSAPRDLLEDVGHAAWSPDGNTIAVVRAPEWHYRLEFPAGKVLYETAGWISYSAGLPEGRHRRVPRPPALRGRPRLTSRSSIDRERRRFSRPGGRAPRESPGPLPARRSGSPRHGRAYPRPLRRNVVGTPAPGRDHALRDDAAGHLPRRPRALRREQRAPRIPGSPSGRDERAGSLGPGVVLLPVLSADGKTAVFTEQGEAGGPGYSVYLRKLDGSAPVRLGEGNALALSPDGKWVLTCSSARHPRRSCSSDRRRRAEAVPEGRDRACAAGRSGPSSRTASASSSLATSRGGRRASSFRTSREERRSPSRRRESWPGSSRPTASRS